MRCFFLSLLLSAALTTQAGALLACGGEHDGGRDRAWRAPERIGDAGRFLGGDEVGVVVDPSGNAHVAWGDYGDDFASAAPTSKSYAPTVLWASRYTPNQGWGPRAHVGDSAGGGGPSLAIDTAGNTFAVWTNPNSSGLWANRYTSSGGWEGAGRIAEPGGSATIACDANGNAIAIWRAASSIWANRYTSGGGWDAAELVQSSEESLGSPVLAVDAAGNALAMWEQVYDYTYHVWANRYTSGGGWDAAGLVQMNAFRPYVATNAHGSYLATWVHFNGTEVRSIWASPYSHDGGWGMAERVDAGGDEGTFPASAQVAVDARGNALALWTQASSPSPYAGNLRDLWANRYTSGQGWGLPERIESEDVLTVSGPRLAMDAKGNGLAVWLQRDRSQYTETGIWANRYTVANGWGVPERIEDHDRVASPGLAMDPSGNALAVWTASPPQSGVWGSWFK